MLSAGPITPHFAPAVRAMRPPLMPAPMMVGRRGAAHFAPAPARPLVPPVVARGSANDQMLRLRAEMLARSRGYRNMQELMLAAQRDARLRAEIAALRAQVSSMTPASMPMPNALPPPIVSPMPAVLPASAPTPTQPVSPSAPATDLTPTQNAADDAHDAAAADTQPPPPKSHKALIVLGIAGAVGAGVIGYVVVRKRRHHRTPRN